MARLTKNQNKQRREAERNQRIREEELAERRRLARQAKTDRKRELMRNGNKQQPQAVPMKSIANDLKHYFDLRDHPFDSVGCKIPFCPNISKTVHSTVARTTATIPVQVTAGMTRQIFLFPGHAIEHGVDDYASHSGFSTMGGVNYSVGPVNTSSTVAMIGGLSQNIASGGAATVVEFAAGAPITNDIALPYIASNGKNEHTRWRLVAMGYHVVNTTPLLDRGGTLVSCQPNSPLSSEIITQAGYKKFRNYHVEDGNACERIAGSWVPSSADTGYWHVVPGLPANNGTESVAGIYLWANAPAAKAQTYRCDVVCHWEIAGEAYRTVESPSIPQPGASDLSDSVGAIQSTGHEYTHSATALAAGIKSGIGEQVVKNVGARLKAAGTTYFHDLARKAAGSLGESVLSTIENAVLPRTRG